MGGGEDCGGRGMRPSLGHGGRRLHTPLTWVTRGLRPLQGWLLRLLGHPFVLPYDLCDIWLTLSLALSLDF